MNKLLLFPVLGFSWLGCFGGKPEIPNDDLFPFIVYFESRTRGFCVGSLVSRMVVLTAAVCVADIYDRLEDPRPVNVITGTRYRHAWRGVRVQVTKVLMPKLPDNFETRHYLLQKSVALLLLKRKVPDILTEHPLRAIDVDYDGNVQLAQKEDCVVIGWHFFYPEDKILPSKWFKLHKHMRYQRMRVMDTEKYCGSLMRQYETAEGFKPSGNLTRNDVVCLQDQDFTAQPCHGMYGAPVVCGSGRVVGLLSAPDAQSRDCTGYTAVVHRISNQVNRDFLQCVNKLFDPEYHVKWEQNQDSDSDCKTGPEPSRV